MTTAQDDDTKPIHASYRRWAGGAIIGLALLSFGLIRPDDGTVPFFVLLALAAAGYFATLHQVANGLRPSGRVLIACAGLALAWRVPMLLAPPEPGADLRRYVWDARVVRAGLSPYAVIPADPAFAHLRTSESWPINNPDVPSPYPPGAQLFFLAATTPSESARAIKVAALVCDALLALVVWRWLVAAGANPGWVLAYLWSPLVSLEVARHGHLDVVGALCVAFAAFALLRGRALLGSIAFAMSVAVKPLPIVLLPLLWRRVSRRHLVAGFGCCWRCICPSGIAAAFPSGPCRTWSTVSASTHRSSRKSHRSPALRRRRGSRLPPAWRSLPGRAAGSRWGRRKHGRGRWRQRSFVHRWSIPGTSSGSRRSWSRRRRCR